VVAGVDYRKTALIDTLWGIAGVFALHGTRVERVI
jgi:hypothetical protein